MWISKKKWQALEKRVADLEGQVQGQLEVKIDSDAIRQALEKRVADLEERVQGQPDLKVEDIKCGILNHDKNMKRSTFF